MVAMPLAADASAKSNYETGAAAFKNKDYAKAEKYFLLGVKESGSDPNLHYGLASTLQASGKDARARDEYKRCIQLAPTSKLAAYARQGLGYLDNKEIAAAPPLPAPTAPMFSADNAWHTTNQPTQLAPGLPSSTLQTSSGYSGYSGGFSSPTSSLPMPTPPAYGPNAGAMPSNFIGYTGRMHGHHHHGGYSNPTMAYASPYSPYAFGPPHTPVMQIRTYGNVPPLNIHSASAPAEQTPPVELMATQGKLVIDEQPQAGAKK
jgi:hypothetical protein